VGRLVLGPEKLAHFESVLLPHLDAAYGLARYLMRDDHDAEDVVQDAYLRAVRHFEGFRGGDGRAWLLAIVRRTCYTQLKRRRDGPTVAVFDDQPDPAIDPVDVLEMAEQERLRETLSQAVAALPVEFREVVVLRDLEGLSYKEISSVVGVPIGTVMSRLARGRRRLHAAIPIGERERE